MKQLHYGVLLVTTLAGCTPTHDGLYRLMISAREHKWLEIEPIWNSGSSNWARTTFRVWYVHQPGWQYWRSDRYELSPGALGDLPMIERLKGDTIAIHMRGHKGINWVKYTFRGAWPAVQLQK